MLISLVQERLSEDDCLRRVRLRGTACLGMVARRRGKGWTLCEVSEKVKLATRS